MDLATLGLEIGYQKSDLASKSLDKLSGAAKKAEGSARKMGDGATAAARKMIAANDNAAGSVRRIGGAYRGVIKVLGALGVTLSAVAFGRLVTGAIDSADELAKMSQRIGVSVEELSRLKHAADLSGIGMEEMATGVQMLSRNMSQFK